MNRQLPITNYQLRIARYVLAFFALLLVAFASFTVASAQGSTPPTDDEVNAVAHKLYCPVCESTPLDVCPTDACKDWREQIRIMLAEGKTEAEILTYFEEQHGAKVLSEPPKQGFYWLVYLIPPAFILAGAFVLLRSMKQWTTATAEAADAAPQIQDDYVSRFEEEAKKQK